MKEFKMSITPLTIRYWRQYLPTRCNETIAFIDDSVPKYVIDFLNHNHVKCHKGNMDIIPYKDNNIYQWPSKEELESNQLCAIYDDRSLINSLKYKRNDYKLIKRGDPLECNSFFVEEDELPADIEYDRVGVVHFFGVEQPNSKRMRYRRFRLQDYLRRKGVLTMRGRDVKYMQYDKDKCPKILRCDFLVISKPIYWVFPTLRITEIGKIIYDRSDNWGSISDICKKEEDALIERADVIVCSSEWLYKDTTSRFPDKEVHLIENGVKVLRKYNKSYGRSLTASYIGKDDDKLDWDKLNDIARKNPNVTINMYGQYNVWKAEEPNIHRMGFKSLSALHKELSENVDIGLIPWVKSEWTAAMLPLKYYNYLNAGLPVYCWNVESLKNKPYTHHDEDELKEERIDASDYLTNYDWEVVFKKWKESTKIY